MLHCNYVSLSCNITKKLQLVYELGAYVTVYDLQKSFTLNTAVEIVAANAIIVVIVISFMFSICCIFQDIGYAWVSSSWNDLWRSLKVTGNDMVLSIIYDFY